MYTYLTQPPEAVADVFFVLTALVTGLAAVVISLISWRLSFVLAVVCGFGVTLAVAYPRMPPPYVAVTATREPGLLTREERVSKHSVVPVDYMRFKVNDGTGTFYYYRLRDGAAISDHIQLYRVQNR